ncbi:MAG: HNH endonuclease [Chloroflexi bacterium]|nr:HNH endonuclease [Chloroflexota bacterium]
MPTRAGKPRRRRRRRDAWARRGWRQIRERILKRDQHRCQIRGPGCTGRATQVDHIRPLKWGGSNDPGNLRAACAHCNLSRAPRQRGAEPSKAWI